MNLYDEQCRNITDKLSTGEWKDSQVYDAIQNIISLNGGKLYKYRTFDPKGYSLESLQNQEIYCSEPSKFNDPFDCRVGIDLRDIAKTQFASIEPMIEEALREFLAVLKKEKPLESCSPLYQTTIAKFMDDKDLCNIVKQCGINQLNQERIIQLLQKHPKATERYFLGLAQLGQSLAGLCQNPTLTDVILKIYNSIDLDQLLQSGEIDMIDSAMKAYGIEDDVDGISIMKKVFSSQQPEISHELEIMDEQFDQLDKKLSEMVDQNFYVACLSEKYDDVLMWSHYGESHTGFCIEYDFNRISLIDVELLILPALYSDRRPPFPWDITLNTITIDHKQLNYNFLLALLTKNSAWSYEKEWRILRTKKAQSQKVYLPIASCVYIGANCTKENKEKILSITRNMQIPVRQMIVDRGVYKLHALPLNL